MARLAMNVVFVLGLCTPTAASAMPAWLDPFGRVEAGVAFPLRAPQSDYFGPGFGGRLNLGVGFGQWVGAQLTAQMLWLPARASAPTGEAAVPLGVGGGVRLKLPYDRYPVSPWIDADILYVRTGSLDRFGYTVGVGLHVPVDERRIIRLGPFVRLFQIVDSDAPHVNSTDALTFIVGLSVEAGIPHPRRIDVDKDGVLDNEDRCPTQPGPAATFGCPDKDGDKVADLDDKCPDVPGSIAAGGCPDKDGDGVPDVKDKCPDQPGPAATDGCPDRDKDGIADVEDKCPDKPGSPTAAGCPDRDHDGVADCDDKCPDKAGSPTAAGCPDRDKDGVADTSDKCPDVPGSISAAGCPDRDGDGVPDNLDRCPDVPGLADHAGCPMPRAEVTSTSIEINEKIYFATDKTTIEDRSFPILDEVVRALKDNPALRVSIEGHTDNHASAGTDNLKLSERRADAVKAYLVGHGVKSRQLSAKGFGPDRPLDTNDTEEGREKNRRVEFNLVK